MSSPVEKYEYKIIAEEEKSKVLWGVVSCFPVEDKTFLVRKYASKVTSDEPTSIPMINITITPLDHYNIE